MGDMRDFQQFDPLSDIRPVQANDLYPPMIDNGPINENLANEELGSFHTGGAEDDNNTGKIAGALVAVLLLGTAGVFGYQAVANRPVASRSVVSASQLPQTTPPKQVAVMAPAPMAQPQPVMQPQPAAPQQADNSATPVAAPVTAAPVHARVARVTPHEDAAQPVQQPQPVTPSNAIAASVSPMVPPVSQPDAPVDTSSQAAIANSQTGPAPAALQPQPAPGQSPTVQPSQNVAVEPVQVTPPNL
jgi:hypothetical protein